MADVTGTRYAGSADIGYDTELLVGQGNPSPEDFVAVTDVIEIQMGSFDTEVFPKTHLKSPGRAQEKGTGLRDFQPITVRVNWVPTHGSQNNAGGDGFEAVDEVEETGGGLLAIHRHQEERNFIVRKTFTNGTVKDLPFVGAVTGFQPPTFATSGKLEASFTITPLRDYLGEWD